MAIIAGVALALMAQGPVEAVVGPHSDYDVGYEELVANDNAAARSAIEQCDELAADDPARLINHGIALARTGNYEAARADFLAAVQRTVVIGPMHSKKSSAVVGTVDL